MSDKLVAFYSRADENYVKRHDKNAGYRQYGNCSQYYRKVDRCRHIQNRTGTALFPKLQRMYCTGTG